MDNQQPTEVEATIIFLVYPLKQLLYAFDSLNRLTGEDAEPGSLPQAFLMNSVYNYICLFFLLYGTGTAYPALKRHGLEHLLESMRSLLDEQLGSATFGKVILTYRNKIFVHPQYQDSDFDEVYKMIDMSVHSNQAKFYELLQRLYIEIRLLILALVEASGRPYSDFGILL